MTSSEIMLDDLLQGNCLEFLTYEMSGFGRGTTYEMGMQRMLYLGEKWVKDKKIRVFDGMHGYRGIIGIENTDKSQLGELEEMWADDPFLKCGGITGAMHQFVMRHLKVVAEEGGRGGWIALLKKQGAKDSDFFIVRMWP